MITRNPLDSIASWSTSASSAWVDVSEHSTASARCPLLVSAPPLALFENEHTARRSVVEIPTPNPRFMFDPLAVSVVSTAPLSHRKKTLGWNPVVTVTVVPTAPVPMLKDPVAVEKGAVFPEARTTWEPHVEPEVSKDRIMVTRSECPSVTTTERSMKTSDWVVSTAAGSTRRIAGVPPLYSAFVRTYVISVLLVAVTVRRVVHVEGGVSTWTLMFSS